MHALSPKRERWMLLTLAGIQFAHIVDFMIMMPLGPQFMRWFGIGTAQFGLLVSAYTFAAATAAVAAALMVDRLERKRALLTLLGLFTLATLACAVAPGYHWLLAARALAGMFGGVMGALVYTMVGDTVPEARRGRAMGLVMTSFSLATVAGVPLGLTIAAAAGWRWTFVFVAGLAALLFALGLRWLPSVAAHPAAAAGHPLRALWASATYPNHRRAFAFQLLMMFAGFSVIPFLSMTLVFNVGLSEGQLAYVYLAGGVATLFTARRFGAAADRYGKLRVYRVLALLSIVPLLLVTNAPPMPWLLAVAMGALFMVFVSGRMIPGMALITSSAAPGARASFLALNSAVMQAGSGAAALLAGQIVVKLPADQGGHLLHYDRVGYVAVVCTLAAMVWAGRVRVLDAAAPPLPADEPLT